MKKTLLFGMLVCLASAGAAVADCKYTETETITTVEVWTIENVPHGYVVPRKKCENKSAQPVRVKTHTEVIDHYQVYQPVTIYKPVGTQVQRRVIPANKCK